MNRRAFIAGASASWAFLNTKLTFAAADVPNIAFLGFQLINTSLEPTTPAEEQRIRMLDDLFRKNVAASDRYHLVSMPEAIRQGIASGPIIANCNGCEADYARKVGADWAAWGTVQKVSNLILNINLYLEDARTGKMQFSKSVDIRGNTDESWRRGLDYLLQNYLLED